MGIKNSAKTTEDDRPRKKAKHRMPSTAERQLPHFTSVSANKTPASAQQPRTDTMTLSTVATHVTERGASTSTTTPMIIPGNVPDSADRPSALSSQPTSQSDAPLAVLPPHLLYLAKRYSFATMSINTGSKIEQKVRQLISHLSRFNFLDKEVKPGVVALYARSNVASKLISVVEITKRDIESQPKGGKWYQYSRVSSELKEIPRSKALKGSKIGIIGGKDGNSTGKTLKDWHSQKKQDGHIRNRATGLNTTPSGLLVSTPERAESGQEDDGEDAFETMHNPQAGPQQKDTKLRNVPILTIYMARVPVSELQIEFR